MDYIGKVVYHKAKYGKGIITGIDNKGIITVKFVSIDQEKKFQAPSCFEKFGYSQILVGKCF